MQAGWAWARGWLRQGSGKAEGFGEGGLLASYLSTFTPCFSICFNMEKYGIIWKNMKTLGKTIKTGILQKSFQDACPRPEKKASGTSHQPLGSGGVAQQVAGASSPSQVILLTSGDLLQLHYLCVPCKAQTELRSCSCWSAEVFHKPLLHRGEPEAEA